jgi:hypothetical protein
MKKVNAYRFKNDETGKVEHVYLEIDPTLSSEQLDTIAYDVLGENLCLEIGIDHTLGWYIDDSYETEIDEI